MLCSIVLALLLLLLLLLLLQSAVAEVVDNGAIVTYTLLIITFTFITILFNGPLLWHYIIWWIVSLFIITTCFVIHCNKLSNQYSILLNVHCSRVNFIMKLTYDTTYSSAQTVLCKLILNITYMMLVSLLRHCRSRTPINVLIISSSHISRSWSTTRLYSSSIHRNEQDDVDERKVGNFTNKMSESIAFDDVIDR